MTAELSKESSGGAVDSTQLHNVDRAPAAVAEEWRSKLADSETERIEHVSRETLAKVEATRTRLS